MMLELESFFFNSVLSITNESFFLFTVFGFILSNILFTFKINLFSAPKCRQLLACGGGDPPGHQTGEHPLRCQEHSEVG